MNSFGRFLVNGTLMTVVSLFLRAVSVIFNVYISNIIGAEGLGLFTLISTVYGFSLTVATSGINLATTRLVSEAIGSNGISENGKSTYKNNEIKCIVRRCINYALFFSVGVGIVLFFSADYIGNRILFDKRTVSSLRLLAVSLPATALSSALGGYFVAVRRVYKNALVVVFSQFSKIFITVMLFGSIFIADTEKACLAMVCGGVFSEIASFLLQWILYIKDKSKKDNSNISEEYKRTTRKKLLGIALPVAFSAYLRSGLISIEHILIPIGLNKNGSNKSAALAAYGTVQSMVFPIVLFPAAILSSFAGLLIPEVAEANAAGNKEKIARITRKVFRTALIFAIGAAGIIGCFASNLGSTIYPGSDAGKYIRVIAPLIPVMYIDTSTDAILKGLGEQVYTMWVNIIDSSLSVVLVFFLIPKYGIWGYIITVYFTEIINAALSIIRLINIVSISPKVFSWVIKPLISIVLATILTKFIFDITPISFASSVVEMCGYIFLSLIIYFVFLVFTKCVTKKQVQDILVYTKRSIT